MAAEVGGVGVERMDGVGVVGSSQPSGRGGEVVREGESGKFNSSLYLSPNHVVDFFVLKE